MRNKEFKVNQKRDFGNIISDGFTFVKRTFKLQAELFLYLVLPILLLSIYNMYFVLGDLTTDALIADGGSEIMQASKFVLAYAGTIISILIFSFIIYSIAIKYEENGSTLPERGDVIAFMKQNVGRYLLYFFTLAILMAMAIGLVFLFVLGSPVLGVILAFGLAIGGIYILPYFSIFPVLYLKEKKPFIQAIKDVFSLVKGNWMPTFGVVLVTNIIGSFASYVLIIPIYIMMIVSMFGSIDDGSGAGDDVGFYMSLLMIVAVIANVIVMTYTTSAIILKYYDLKERTDNVSIYEKIENIGNTETSIFENEGDF